jgi:hypothetical protein
MSNASSPGSVSPGRPANRFGTPPVRLSPSVAPAARAPVAGSVRQPGAGEFVRVRVPADVDREDEVLAGLTARQVVILAAGGVVVWLAWQAVGRLVPPLVFVGTLAPVSAVVVALALGRRDGLSFDRYVMAAMRHARTPRRQVHAPEGIPDVPDILDSATRAALGPNPSGLAPAEPVADGISTDGVVDLGRDGLSVLAAAGTVNFALRMPAEQEALTGAFAGWLNSLAGPVQILVRSHRTDLAQAVAAIRQQAPALPHPALERAAFGHAQFLTDLARSRDLLHRQTLLVHHQPAPRSPTGTSDVRSGRGASRGSLWVRRRREPGRVHHRRQDAGRGLIRQAQDAARLLAAAEVSVTPLDGSTAAGVLASACHPDRPHVSPPRATDPRPARQARATRTPTADPADPVPMDPAVDRVSVLPWPAPPSPDADRAAVASLPRSPAAAGPGTAAVAEASLTPESVEIGARQLRVGSDHVATLAVTGYPAEVRPGWLEPLLTYPGRLDIALHIEPVPPAVAADRLRKQRARLESTRRMTAARDRLANPEVDAAADDATELAYALARGETRLFRTGIYLSVHAATAAELDDAVAAVRAVAESLLLRIEPVTWRALQGWITTLPLGIDAIRLRRTLDTAALAATFPFTSSDLPATDPARPGDVRGVLYGTNASSPSGLVVWDRWSRDNYNSVILARAGSGKSYLAKLDLLRQLYDGVEVIVIDPENEYTRLAEAVGGTIHHLGRPGVHLNPLDLGAATLHPSDPEAASAAQPQQDGGPAEMFGQAGVQRQALFLRTFCEVAFGGLDATEISVLDGAVTAAYHRAGITHAPRTWARPAPSLGDVAAELTHRAESLPDSDSRAAAGRLATRLTPYVSGSYAGLFNGPTTSSSGTSSASRPGTGSGSGFHLVVYCLRDLPEETKTLATLTTLDTIWQRVTNPTDRRRRLVVIDEAWLLMRDLTAADCLFRMAKASRKHWAGLSLITQDAADLLATDLGRATVNNAATQILMRQSPQAIDLITAAFGLSAGERQVLLSAPRGHGLLLAGAGDRVSFRSLASATEDDLITTNPADLAARAG